MTRHHIAFFLSCLAAFTAGHIVNYSVIMYAQEVLHSDLLAGIGFGLCFGPPLVQGWYAGVVCWGGMPAYYATVIHQSVSFIVRRFCSFLPPWSWPPLTRILPILLPAHPTCSELHC